MMKRSHQCSIEFIDFMNKQLSELPNVAENSRLEFDQYNNLNFTVSLEIRVSRKYEVEFNQQPHLERKLLVTETKNQLLSSLFAFQ